MIWIEFDGHEDVVLIKDDVTVNGQYISNHGPAQPLKRAAQPRWPLRGPQVAVLGAITGRAAWKGHLSFETIVCKAVTDAR